MPGPERVIVYIDGFNLYFGMSARFPKLKWLNLYELGINLLKPHQILVGVKYFTARLSGNPPKERRQNLYLNALKTTPAQIIYGQYNSSAISCKRCHHSWAKNEEKMDTEEATYIWHLDKNNQILSQKLQAIDQDLNMIKNNGRQIFLDSQPKDFSRVMHDYSEERKGFIVWKDLMEERLI